MASILYFAAFDGILGGLSFFEEADFCSAALDKD